jgi:hypothetical protein
MKNNLKSLATVKNSSTKTIYGIVGGITIYVIVGLLGLFLLKFFWTDYAIATKDKSYTFSMKLLRLTVGVFASIFTGNAATIIAKDKGKTAWLVGIIIFCIVGYNHFFIIWADYPIWYHLAYLIPIIPVVGLSHYLLHKRKRNKFVQV